MKQSAVEWLFEESHNIPLEKFDNREDYVKEYFSRPLRILKQAKKMEKKLQDYFPIGFANWLDTEEAEQLISDLKMVGELPKIPTNKELLQIYKKEKRL